MCESLESEFKKHMRSGKIFFLKKHMKKISDFFIQKFNLKSSKEIKSKIAICSYHSNSVRTRLYVTTSAKVPHGGQYWHQMSRTPPLNLFNIAMLAEHTLSDMLDRLLATRSFHFGF